MAHIVFSHELVEVVLRLPHRPAQHQQPQLGLHHLQVLLGLAHAFVGLNTTFDQENLVVLMDTLLFPFIIDEIQQQHLLTVSLDNDILVHHAPSNAYHFL